MGLSTAAYFAAVCFLPALLTSAVTTALMRRLAPKWGLVDHPNLRKVHTAPTPLGGGIGIWLGVVLPIGAAHLSVWLLRVGELSPDWIPGEIAVHFEGVLYRSGQMWSILAAGTLLVCMGFLDDLKNIPWQPRLLIQCLVAVALVAGGVRATLFAPQPWIGMVMSVLWILVLVNAFNFLDNMDGLSSGTAMIASLLFAVIMLASSSQPHWLVGGALLVLAGSLQSQRRFAFIPQREDVAVLIPHDCLPEFKLRFVGHSLGLRTGNDRRRRKFGSRLLDIRSRDGNRLQTPQPNDGNQCTR